MTSASFSGATSSGADEQAQLLRHAGCTHLQGFLFGRPGSMGEVLPGESRLVSALPVS